MAQRPSAMKQEFARVYCGKVAAAAVVARVPDLSTVAASELSLMHIFAMHAYASSVGR